MTGDPATDTALLELAKPKPLLVGEASDLMIARTDKRLFIADRTGGFLHFPILPLIPPPAAPQPWFSPGLRRRIALAGWLAAVWFIGGATAAVLLVL